MAVLYNRGTTPRAGSEWSGGSIDGLRETRVACPPMQATLVLAVGGHSGSWRRRALAQFLAQTKGQQSCGAEAARKPAPVRVALDSLARALEGQGNRIVALEGPCVAYTKLRPGGAASNCREHTDSPEFPRRRLWRG